MSDSTSTRADLVTETITRCRAVSELHGRVADVFYDHPRQSMAGVMARVGIDYGTARRLIYEVRCISHDVLYEASFS